MYYWDSSVIPNFKYSYLSPSGSGKAKRVYALNIGEYWEHMCNLEQGCKDFIHCSRKHNSALIALGLACWSWQELLQRAGNRCSRCLAVVAAEKPSWYRYHFPWGWKKVLWNTLADITRSVGNGRMTWIGISNAHVITDHCGSLSRREKNGQHWTVVEKRMLMSTCCFLIILSWWFFDIGIPFVAFHSFI